MSQAPDNHTVSLPTLISVSLVALSTLMMEVLLTRIWSVTTWYHFAFVAISISMFGLTAGALAVLIFRQFFNRDNYPRRIVQSALCLAVSTAVCFITHLTIPFFPDKSLVGLYSLVLTYAIVSIPFIFSGICITLVLNNYARDVAVVYGFDLLGAAFGCLSVLFILKVADAPSAMIAAAAIAAFAAYLLSKSLSQSDLVKPALAALAVLSLLFFANAYACSQQHSFLRPLWVKAQFEPRPLFEKWNSFSRVTVVGNPDRPVYPSGWGVSRTFPAERRVRLVNVVFDAYYATPITHYSGKDSEIEHLKYDVVNTANYLRHNAEILVLGTGGGRDVLSAFAFKQKRVVGVDINEEVFNLLTKRFADFAGHIDQEPRVKLSVDEARSFVSRSRDKFDIIQISLIDTQSATGAGAYALTENSLYTRQAWKLFLEHLKAHGILTCTRLDYQGKAGELERMVALARTALLDLGVEHPEDNILVVGQRDPDADPGLGVVLVSRDAFSSEDIAVADKLAAEMKFQIMYSPEPNAPVIAGAFLDQQKNKDLRLIARGETAEAFLKAFPILLDAPTDDKPFFFYMLKPQDLFSSHDKQVGTPVQYTKAEELLIELWIVVSLLTVTCILLPLKWKAPELKASQELPSLVYFACIGLAFMFIEISQLQRLTIFLGHPSYSLSVVLFTILIASGLGSLTADRLFHLEGKPGKWLLNLLLPSLVLMLLLYNWLVPALLIQFAGAETWPRIMVAVLALFPVGYLMGFAMPAGLRMAYNKHGAAAVNNVLPWFWGINGALSVWGSVAAVVVAINWGISAAFAVGVISYAIAALAFLQLASTAEARE